jgi:hypothetical protein
MEAWEVMRMLYPILILAVITAICVLGGRYLPDLNSPAWGRRRAPSAAQPGAVASIEPESLEGVLVAQLVAGEITPSQYRRSIEGLAARDDDRNPLSVPPDVGSADA